MKLFIYLCLCLSLIFTSARPLGSVITEIKNPAYYENTGAKLYNDLSSPEISRNAFLLAYTGYCRLKAADKLKKDSLLTIIDYSKPSDCERMFVIDLKNRKLLEHTLVAHGRESGIVVAKNFSNQIHSNQSSLGFFITNCTYSGKHGYSLRIDGVEPEINDNAIKRAIVIHAANYVSREFISQYGRLGRSFGCPALPVESCNRIIDLIKGASCIFVYAPEEEYLESSKLLNSSSLP
jgi:hypothetical protein